MGSTLSIFHQMGRLNFSNAKPFIFRTFFRSVFQNSMCLDITFLVNFTLASSAEHGILSANCLFSSLTSLHKQSVKIVKAQIFDDSKNWRDGRLQFAAGERKQMPPKLLFPHRHFYYS